MRAAGASVVAAVVASACCIGPVAVALLGGGAFGASLTVLEPYRPILLATTVAFLGAGFYAAYRPVRDCDACAPDARHRARIIMWLAAMMVVVLVTFPYYVGFLF